MGEKRAMTVLGGLMLGGWLLLGCDRGGEGGSGASEVVDAEGQPLAVGRPEGATKGPRVGVVVAATADVRVVPSQGAPFAATEGMMLVKDDKLSTGSDAGSFVVVELYNGHIVRFNQSTSIVVAGISVFEAPRAGDDLAARFERVLRPEEQGDSHLRGAISRVAGWNSRMTATETIAALPSSPPPSSIERDGDPAPVEVNNAPSPLDDIVAADVPSRGGTAAEPIPVDAKKDLPGSDSEATQKKNSSSQRPKDDFEESKRAETEPTTNKKPKNSGPEAETPSAPEPSEPPEPSKPEPSKPEPSKTEPKGTLDLPSTVSFKPDAGAGTTIKLPAALVVGRNVLAACAGAGATIRARVEKKVIVRIEVVGGSGKKCTEGVGRGVDLADGVLELRVKS